MNVDQETIEQMYFRMEQDGWDTTTPLKWGFFFVSKDEENLKGVYSELVGHGYEVGNIDVDEDGDWTLQVSKLEVLGSDKLCRKCIAFNDLAEAYESYFDGWDVGKAADA